MAQSLLWVALTGLLHSFQKHLVLFFLYYKKDNLKINQITRIREKQSNFGYFERAIGKQCIWFFVLSGYEKISIKDEAL